MNPAPHVELDSRSPDAIDGRQIRAVAFQDVRLEYVRQVLARVGMAAGDSTALVVGAGRGLLAYGLAGLGFQVTAVDPSATATELARAANADNPDSGPRVVHQTARPEALGVPRGGFDLAYYADTFEITSDLNLVVSQAAAVLRPGGVLVYDTVNRTLPSRLVYLGAFQGLPMTRIVPPGRYAARRLRTPDELTAVLAENGLDNQDICGFKPKRVRDLVRAVLARRRGDLTDEQIPPVVDFVLAPQGKPVVTYLGYATKRGVERDRAE